MLTVVIPTILKCNIDAFKISLNEMINAKNISEIIIIDNSEEKSFKTLNFFKSNKINLIDNKENLFVNPSWNYGAKIAQNETLLYINDDIICKDFIFEKLEQELNELTGMTTCEIINDKNSE